MKSSILFLTFSFFFTCLAIGQIDNLPKDFSLEEHKKEYFKLGAELGMHEKVIEKSYERKINIANHEAFADLGVDVINPSYDYKYKALSSWVIVKGTVVEIMYNTKPGVRWHTSYKIKITRIIKKRDWAKNKYITLKKEGGPVDCWPGVRAGIVFEGGIGKCKSLPYGEVKYSLGEKVLLHLQPMKQVFSILEKYYTEGGKPELINRLNADKSNPNCFISISNYKVVSNYLHIGKRYKFGRWKSYVYNYDRRKIGIWSTMKKEIKKMMRLNTLESFYNLDKVEN